MACLPSDCPQPWRHENPRRFKFRPRPNTQTFEDMLAATLVGSPIVESRLGLLVAGVDQREERLPPHTWLVLDSPLEEPSVVTAAGDDVCTSDPSTSLALVGGGYMLPGELMRCILADELSLKAAEANFTRASRGISVLALRHAVYILELLVSCGARPRPASPAERARRLEPMVAARAKAALERRTIASQSRASEDTEPEVLVEGLIHRQSRLQKGFLALQDFLAFMCRRFGNPVRGWFQLDPQENMRIGEKQFVRGCEDICFRGNVAALWWFLNSDKTGSISLLSIDPRSATLLAGFKVFIQERFAGSVETLVEFLDESRSNRLGRPHFVSKLRELGFKGSASRLFDLLDRLGLGYVSPSDFGFLQKWNPPPYLFSAADHEGLQRLKGALQEREGSLLRAWRKALDKDGSMRISFEEFTAACAELSRGKRGKLNGLPANEAEVCAVWRAMDEDCSGWIALREFDPVSFEALAEFKRWAVRAYGGAVRAFRHLDSSTGASGCKLGEGDFRKCKRGPDGCKADLDFLFDGLDIHNAWVLTENEVRFIDEWDLAWEDWEVTARQKSASGRLPVNHGPAGLRCINHLNG